MGALGVSRLGGGLFALEEILEGIGGIGFHLFMGVQDMLVVVAKERIVLEEGAGMAGVAEFGESTAEGSHGEGGEGAGGAEAGGLVVFRRGLGSDADNPMHGLEGFDGLVEDGEGDLQLLGKLIGTGGGLAAVEGAGDLEEDGEGEEFTGFAGEAGPCAGSGLEVDGLGGAGELTAEEDKDPEEEESDHKDGDNADGAVEALEGEDAVDVEDGKVVIEEEEEGGEEAADEGGFKGDVGIGEEAVEEDEQSDEHGEGEEGAHAEEDRGEGAAKRHIAGEDGDVGGGEESGGAEAEDGTEADEAPVINDALAVGAPFTDSPDLVEGGFDGGEQLYNDPDQDGSTEDAEGSGAAGIDLFYEGVGALDDLIEEAIEGGGHFLIGGLGGRLFEVAIFLEGRGDEEEAPFNLAPGVGIDEGTGDHDDDGDGGAEGHEGGIAEGGGFGNEAIFPHAIEGEEEDAHPAEEPAALAGEELGLDLPEPVAAKGLEAIPLLAEGSAFGGRGRGSGHNGRGSTSEEERDEIGTGGEAEGSCGGGGGSGDKVAKRQGEGADEKAESESDGGEGHPESEGIAIEAIGGVEDAEEAGAGHGAEANEGKDFGGVEEEKDGHDEVEATEEDNGLLEELGEGVIVVIEEGLNDGPAGVEDGKGADEEQDGEDGGDQCGGACAPLGGHADMAGFLGLAFGGGEELVDADIGVRFIVILLFAVVLLVATAENEFFLFGVDLGEEGLIGFDADPCFHGFIEVEIIGFNLPGLGEGGELVDIVGTAGGLLFRSANVESFVHAGGEEGVGEGVPGKQIQGSLPY